MWCVLLVLIPLSGCDEDTMTPREIVDPLYRPGQEWAFATRPGEEAATLIVLRTEDMGAGNTVVHVAVRGLRMRNENAATGVSSEIGHLPFARSALDASGLTLRRDSVPIPPFEDGYAEWRDARGGVWSLPVAAVIDAMEEVLNHGTRVPAP